MFYERLKHALFLTDSITFRQLALSTQHSAPAKTDLVVSVSWRVQTLFHCTLC
jgi:hypothetical protein